MREFFRVNFLCVKQQENAKIHGQKIHPKKFTPKKIHLAKFTPKSTPKFTPKSTPEFTRKIHPKNSPWLEMTPSWWPGSTHVRQIPPPGPIETRDVAVLRMHLAEPIEGEGSGVHRLFLSIYLTVCKKMMTKKPLKKKK